MISIKGLNQEEELLADFISLSRSKKINGEKTISLSMIPTKSNELSYPLAEEEGTVNFDGDSYIIKTRLEKAQGISVRKNVTAIHKFYVDLFNSMKRSVFTGSMSIMEAGQFILEGTGYTFSVIDAFPSQAFENFGGQRRIALMQKLLERYHAEMDVVGTHVTLKKQIGADTDFQFRYGFNTKTFDREFNTNNLATYIEGTGAEGIAASYTSPNIGVFGHIDSEDVADERFTSVSSLTAELKSRLQDEPEVSITIDFEDLRAAGYPYTVPKEGDRVFVIYEPMGNLIIETRIMEIEEDFNLDLVPVRTKVTLANYRKTFAGTMFNSMQKALRKIVNDEGIIRYNALDAATKIATEAITNSLTEIEYPLSGGIVLRDKVDPNLLVALVSGGVGVSNDNGQTFGNAITGNGVTTSLLTAGDIHTNNVRIVGQDDFFYWDGTGLRAVDPLDTNRFVRLRSDGLHIAKGAITIERPDGYVTTNNGISVYDVNIQSASPSMRSGNVVVAGYFWKTVSLSPEDCDYFTYKHQSRYLKLRIGFYVDYGATATLTVERGSVSNNNIEVLATKVTTLYGPANETTITVDLGVPTGEVSGFFIRLKTSDSSTAAYARVSRRWLEG